MAIGGARAAEAGDSAHRHHQCWLGGIHREGLRSNELQQLGYVEGRNIRYEYRFADGFLDRLPGLAEELVRLNPAIIVSAPVPANIAVHKATKTIPIVMSTGADPVGFGLVQSLSHPGGNVTGLTNFAEALAAKQLDLMRELRPDLTRVAVLVNFENPLHVPQWRETQDAAAKASIALVPYEFHKPDDFEPAFAAFAQTKAEALMVPPDTTFANHRKLIVRRRRQAGKACACRDHRKHSASRRCVLSCGACCGR